MIKKKGYATLGEIAKDICKKKGLELETSSFLNSDKKIYVYDNQIKAREYMSYISEEAGGFCCAGRTGKIQIKKIGEDEIIIPQKLFKTYKWGEEHKITKVAYENGTESFKVGDETKDTLWIRQENLFISEEDDIQKIYSSIKDLDFYSFEGTTIINPAIDIGDIINIDGKKVIYQGEMTLNKRFIADIKSKIAIKQKQETTTRKQSQQVVNRKIQSQIDEEKLKLTQLVEETTENSEKLTQHEQTIDSMKDTLKSQETKIKKVESKADDAQSTADTATTKANDAQTIANTANTNAQNAQKTANANTTKITTNTTKIAEVEKTVSEITQSVNNVEEKVETVKDTVNTAKTTAETANTTANTAKNTANTAKSTAEKANTTAEAAKQKANDTDSNLTTNYYTKTETNSQIKQKAESITSEVSKTYSTKTETTNAKQEAIKDANSNTDDKLKGYTETSKLGTVIEQNYEHVKVAWNQISDFIQMMIIKNNASLAILDENKHVIMALDKTGQHFYKSDGTSVFGEMAVNIKDNNYYISFAVDGEYGQDVSEGMAWGIKTKSDNKYHPILFIKNFHMGSQNSDDIYGQLVLKYCDLVLAGMETGIQSGNVKLYGNIFSGITFEDSETGASLFSIYPANSKISGAENGGLAILDNISLYKNEAGSNSFKLSKDKDHYIVQTDEGDFTMSGGAFILGDSENAIDFTATVNTAYFWGNVDVEGNFYAKSMSSDMRIKSNVIDCKEKALDIIKKIEHKEYDKIDDGKHYKIGYIAQQMEKLDSNFVVKRPENKEKGIDERYYINELPIIATITKAIQEQQEQIEKLQEELEKIKKGEKNERN